MLVCWLNASQCQNALAEKKTRITVNRKTSKLCSQ